MSEQASFRRGCCLSSCLLYLGFHALVLLGTGLLLTFPLIPGVAAHWPQLLKQNTPLDLVRGFYHLPQVMIGLLGLVMLSQVSAIWRGWRWGVYGITLLVLSHMGWNLLGVHNANDVVMIISNYASTLVPYGLLIVFVSAKWDTMR